MIERIIENWLINSTERSYTIPFCQVLGTKGYRILHISKHGVAEQGKDIIARDQQNKPCGFQLKSGDLNTTKWRGIRGEIEDLVQQPIAFPGVDPREQRRAVLVTNGVITEDVRLSINGLNTEFELKGWPALEVVTKQELLQSFIEAQGSFLPNEPKDIRDFLELYLSDGRMNLDKGKCASYIHGTLFKANQAPNPHELERRIAGTLLLVKYSLLPYEMVENHIAIVESLVILCAHVLALAEQHDLHDRFWRSSYNLCLYAIRDSLDRLREEIKERNNLFFEGEILGDGGEVYRARTTMVLGWVAGNEISHFIEDPTYELDGNILEVIRHNWPDNVSLWGESATVHFILSALCASLFGDKELACDIYQRAIAELAAANNSESDSGLADPYYSVEQVLSEVLQIEDLGIDFGSFAGTAFTLKPLIDCIVREDRRDILEINWDNISRTDSREFTPEPVWNTYFWNSDTGTESLNAFERPQSWAQLREKAFLPPIGIPTKMLSVGRSLLPLFLLTYPHRLRSDLVRIIDHNLVEDK